MQYIKDVLAFLNFIRQNDTVLVKFVKENGEERFMKCTLNFDRIPKRQQPKKIDFGQMLKLANVNKVLRVFDLESDGWRSIPYDRTEWVEEIPVDETIVPERFRIMKKR